MAAGSPGKTPGFLRDFSGLGGEAKMQAEQSLCFGPYRFTPRPDSSGGANMK